MNTGIFNVNDLMRCYAPPTLGSVMPGNRVMLLSGGPEMTVCDTDDQGRAIAQWVDGDGKLQKSSFELHCLTCWGAR